MYTKIQSSILISFLVVTGFGFLASCDDGNVTPSEELNPTSALARRQHDSLPGWHPKDSLPWDTLICIPRDSILIDTVRKKHPPKDSIHHLPPWHFPKDSIRKDTIRKDTIRRR